MSCVNCSKPLYMYVILLCRYRPPDSPWRFDMCFTIVWPYDEHSKLQLCVDFFLYILVYCIAHWIYDPGMSENRVVVVVCSNMMGMIWPPGWVRVNWSSKTGKGGGTLSHLSPSLPGSYDPSNAAVQYLAWRENHISMLTDKIWYESYFNSKLLGKEIEDAHWNILQ